MKESYKKGESESILAPSLAAGIARCWSKRRQGYQWGRAIELRKVAEQGIDDTTEAGKHPEFIAIHMRTGKKVGVETKSRQRPGAMNYIGTITPETHLEGDVFDLYEKAIQQHPLAEYHS